MVILMDLNLDEEWTVWAASEGGRDHEKEKKMTANEVVTVIPVSLSLSLIMMNSQLVFFIIRFN